MPVRVNRGPGDATRPEQLPVLPSRRRDDCGGGSGSGIIYYGLAVVACCGGPRGTPVGRRPLFCVTVFHWVLAGQLNKKKKVGFFIFYHTSRFISLSDSIIYFYLNINRRVLILIQHIYRRSSDEH